MKVSLKLNLFITSAKEVM